MKFLHILFFGTSFLIGNSVGAHTIFEDFKKLNQHYLEMASYSMEFEVKYQAAGEGNLMVQKGKVIHTDDLHYVSLAGNITLIRKNEFVAVNESTKTLVYNKNEEKQKTEKAEPADIQAMLDSLWANQENLNYRYLETEKGKRKVYLEDKNNVYYSAYAITIDAKKYSLLEFVYYVRPEANNEVNKVIITYQNETAKPKTGLPECKISHYITGTSGSLKPAELYKNYEFIDQTKIRYDGK